MPDRRSPETRKDTPALRTLRRRAYEELGLALDLSNGELPEQWLREGDPDLQRLREANDREWRLLVLRASGKAGEKTPRFPEPAWGSEHKRRDLWAALAVMLAMLAVAAFMLFAPLLFVAGVGVVLLVVGGYVALRILDRATLVLVAGALVLLAAAGVLSIVLPAWLVIGAVLVIAAAASMYESSRKARAARAHDWRAIKLAVQAEQPGRPVRRDESSDAVNGKRHHRDRDDH